jgi:ribosome-associated toxin RatA of RatAB toxin-antitoxin module
MYEMVKDVEQYQDFLPWCKRSHLIKEEADKVCGELLVSRLGIRQTFSSCNHLIPYQEIEIELLKGPFKKLEGRWLFQELREDASKISLHLEFEFSGKLIDKAFGRVFNEIANTLVDAFCKRAKELYRE